jgi:flagellar basal body P-ring formation protein FlgA
MYKGFIKLIVILLAGTSIAIAEETNFLQSALQDLIQKELPNDKASIEVRFNSPDKLASLNSKIEEIKDVKLEKFNPSNPNFIARIIYNNGQGESVSGNFTSFIEVPVAAKFIKQNDQIDSDAIKMVQVRSDKIRKDYATDIAEVINMKARKHIAAGTMFSNNDLIKPPAIKTSDPVNIVYVSGAISLKATGTALGSGSIGDNIKIKNDSSGAVLLGEIINKNTVKVGGN